MVRGRKRGDNFIKLRWVVNDNGCWVWQLKLTTRGYARARYDRKPMFVYKKHYEDKYGPVPDGMELDHLCENKACVNPDHVEAVTHLVNVRRGGRASRFTMETAREVRRLYFSRKMYQYKIAELYGTHQSVISLICRNVVWKEE